MTDNDIETTEEIYLPEPQDVTMASIYEQLYMINSNLSLLVDTLRWEGKYESIDISVDPNTERRGYPFDGNFKFRPRNLVITANQPITIQLNSVENHPIALGVTDMPFNLPILYPALNLKRIFITTGQNSTRLKILAFG